MTAVFARSPARRTAISTDTWRLAWAAPIPTVAPFRARTMAFDRTWRTARQAKSSLRAELVARQAELAHLERETAAMLENPEVEISRVIRNNALVAELRSYVKGLQFQVGPVAEI